MGVRYIWLILVLLIQAALWGHALLGGTVLDQIAVVVGKYLIKTSDIDRDLRVTQFLNSEPVDLSVGAKKAAVQRLIDQQLIRRELAQAGNTSNLGAQAQELVNQIRNARFKGSATAMNMELHRRGLSQEELLQQLQWQLVVLRFIDERFRPGVMLDDAEIRTYYEQHRDGLRAQGPGATTLETATPKIRETLEGERINRNFEDWLDQTRTSMRIEFKLDVLK